jgi:hypothetical protein
MLCGAWSNDASSKTITYKWFKHFKNGRTSTDDNEQSGQSQTQDPNTIALVKNVICGNGQLTVLQVAREVGIPTGSRHTILMKI